MLTRFETLISRKEQNVNKQMAEFGISILFQSLIHIFNTCKTVWEPC